MIEKENLSRDELLSDELFLEMMDLTSETEIAKLEIKYSNMAKLLGCKVDFEKMLKAAKAEKKKIQAENKKVVPFRNDFADGVTHFMGEYDELRCGSWICSRNGIFVMTNYGESYACSHPILPIKILKNVETGFCKVVIAFLVRNKWQEIIVDKEIISSSSKIVSLSKSGIRVTSENARNLVSYLSDIEAMNEDGIIEYVSTSKLGWINGEFMPYGSNVIFDNECGLKNTFDAITHDGNREEWYKLVSDIRKDGKMESKIYLVSSFASVMLEFVNALPFIVNLYGTTGKGKTLSLMLAASVWADPTEGKFMTDAKSTATASEIRLNFLNNLPLLIDDMAQIKNQYDNDFSKLIYAWCSGVGKGRGTQSLGLTSSMTWKNIIITNAERSLVNESSQGGAINRVIDVEMQCDQIYENGNKIVELLRANYGYAGREFVELLQSMNKEQIQEIQKGYYNRIVNRCKNLGTEKEEKQMLPMSVLLATDYLIEKHLFRDGCLLDFEKCVDLLKSKNEVSENERAYNYLLDEIQMNNSKFASKEDVKTLNECWGIIDTDKALVMINGNAFDNMMKKGNYEPKSFLSWLAKNDKIEIDAKGIKKKNKRINGINGRCVFLKLSGYIDIDENGFIKIDESQEKLPFE